MAGKLTRVHFFLSGLFPIEDKSGLNRKSLVFAARSAAFGRAEVSRSDAIVTKYLIIHKLLGNTFEFLDAVRDGRGQLAAALDSSAELVKFFGTKESGGLDIAVKPFSAAESPAAVPILLRESMF